MNDSFTAITLNITEILALLGVAWGLGKMSQKLDTAVASFKEVAEDVKKLVGVIADLMGRVRVLEDRDEQAGGRRGHRG